MAILRPLSYFLVELFAKFALLGIGTWCAPTSFDVHRNAINWMEYFEDLPNNCPPPDATPTIGKFFRLIEGDTIKESDFHSHKLKGLWPASFKNRTECEASSLSVLTTLAIARQYVNTIPTLKGYRIVELTLKETDGVAKQTGPEPAHYSWWRKSTFCYRECEKQLAE